MWPSALGRTIMEPHLGDKSLLSHLDSHGPRKKKKKKKSKFNYRDSIGKHVQTHKSKLIGTHLVVTNTCTYSDVHKHVRTQTLTLTHTHTHIQMKGIEMAANPSTLDRNQFPTWNLC